MNFDLGSYPDGEYELSTKAYNVPRTENGVTKTYVSDASITHFTLMNNLVGADLVILNSSEFYDYIYGKETYVNRADEIKKYVDNILYAPPALSTQQKGLFLVIDLKDEDIDTYHVVKAGLKKGDTVVTPTIYNVAFAGGNTTGDKTGYVFIPLSAMLTGSFEDVTIELSLTEYFDAAHTMVKGHTATTVGVSVLKDILYIGMDDASPTVTISEPGPKSRTQNISISASDVGLGIRELSYQIVNAGDSPLDGGWITVPGNSKNIEFNNPGTYDIYVKAVDRAGNETIKKQENIEVAFVNIDVDTVHVIKPGDPFDVITTIITDLDVTDVDYYIEGDEGHKVTPDKTMDVPVGDYDKEKYEGELVFPPETPNGQHIIVVEVTLGDGSVVVITKPIRVVDTYGTILGTGVDHTPAWEQHRLEYNANYDPDRDKNVFWAGEAFVVSANIEFSDIDTVNEGCLLERVTIEGTPYVYDFTDYISSGDWMHDLEVQGDGKVRIHQSGNLFDETMITRFGPGAVLTFKFEFTDGSIRYETVIVDSTTEYFLYHRAH